jgi:hypothetical protein
MTSSLGALVGRAAVPNTTPEGTRSVRLLLAAREDFETGMPHTREQAARERASFFSPED